MHWLNEKDFIKDHWLSECFQYDVFRLQTPALLDDMSCKEDRSHISPLEKRPVLVYTKVPVDRVNLIHSLEDIGFRIIDTNTVLEKPIQISEVDPRFSASLRFALPEDVEGVRSVARKGFMFSRFHLDPEIPNETADLVKAGWASNFFAGKRGDGMIVAVDGEKIIGFLLFIYLDDTLLIDLIAVESAYRGRGIAKAIIAFCQNKLRNFKTIRVGTQLANVPSLRLYHDLGFHISKAFYVLHYHNQPHTP